MNKKHLKKFLETGECINCDLSGASFDSDISYCNLEGANLENVIFLDDAELCDVNFKNANLTNADCSGHFSGDEPCNFENANLSGANLSNCDFNSDGLDVSINFNNANLSHANFTNSSLQYVDFTNANLSHANFTKSHLWGIDFTSTNLENVDFTSSNIIEANFTNSDLRRTCFNKVVFGDIHEDYVATITFVNANLCGANLSEVVFSGECVVNFSNANLDNASLQSARISTPPYWSHYSGDVSMSNANDELVLNFKDTSLINADLTNVNFEQGRGFGVGINFINANLTSANLSEANLSEANFYKANLTNTNLTNTSFENSRCGYAIFVNTIIKGANFNGSQLKYANFTDVNLDNAKISDLHLELVNSTHTYLKSINNEWENLEQQILDDADQGNVDAQYLLGLSLMLDSNTVQEIAISFDFKSRFEKEYFCFGEDLNIYGWDIKYEGFSTDIGPFDYHYLYRLAEYLDLDMKTIDNWEGSRCWVEYHYVVADDLDPYKGFTTKDFEEMDPLEDEDYHSYLLDKDIVEHYSEQVFDVSLDSIKPNDEDYSVHIDYENSPLRLYGSLDKFRTKAISWLSKAAEQGHEKAQEKLSLLQSKFLS